MAETYSSETVKEFALRKSRLTLDTLGKTREDIPSIVSAIGGLQYGGHKIELFNRFKDFKAEWFDYWYEKHALIEGHVLRGALRITTVDEYPYFFKATRTVARALHSTSYHQPDHTRHQNSQSGSTPNTLISKESQRSSSTTYTTMEKSPEWEEKIKNLCFTQLRSFHTS